jgi:transcriptional regulator with AAA-type ATPase domain
MSEAVLLVGFEKSIVSSLSSLFPGVTIKASPNDFSYEDLRRYCKGTNCVFINGEPSVFLNLLKGKSNYIHYPGNGIISYRGDQRLNLNFIWELFINRKIFIFGLPRELHVQNLGDIAMVTGGVVKTYNDREIVSLDIKLEHKNYLSGFIFAQLFSFLPEQFTSAEYHDRKIENAGCLIKSYELINNLFPRLQNIKPQSSLSLLEMRSLLDSINDFAQHVKEDVENIYLRTFGDWLFNGVEEIKLDNNHPLACLYPKYMDDHIHRWLWRTPDIRYGYPLVDRNCPICHLVNPCHAENANVFLLPPPESTEDILMPISAVLDDLSQGTNPSDLRELYKNRFQSKRFPIIGESTSMQFLYRQIIPVLNDRTGHVLIMGETGTGKELVANIIKEWQGETLQSVNCSHLTANIAHSNLFGYVDGAFTGAMKGGKQGYINEQGHGSLFLDEIQSLPEEVMPMLLRYLEAGEFVRMGDTKVKKSSIRIIAASNDDQMLDGKFVSSGFIARFRYIISVPSLKYRGDDIKGLVQHFAEKAKADLNLAQATTISEQQIEVLKNTDWRHSNVRGLKNAVYNLLARKATVDFSGMQPAINGVATRVIPPSAPNDKECKAGRPKKIGDDLLHKILSEANNTKDLLEKFRSYKTKPYLNIETLKQRINGSDNRDELAALFRKFASDYPKKRDEKKTRKTSG